MRYEPVELFLVDGIVIAEVLVRGSGRDSGIPVENRRFHVIRLRGDRAFRGLHWARRGGVGRAGGGSR